MTLLVWEAVACSSLSSLEVSLRETDWAQMLQSHQKTQSAAALVRQVCRVDASVLAEAFSFLLGLLTRDPYFHLLLTPRYPTKFSVIRREPRAIARIKIAGRWTMYP